MPQKVCIFPSSELNSAFGTISRQASYQICDRLQKDSTVLCCLPALYKGVQEDVDFITDCPVITLEGDPMHNAAKIVKRYSQGVAVEIDIQNVLKENAIDISDSSAEKLGPNGEKAVKFLVEYTAKAVDNLHKTRPCA